MGRENPASPECRVNGYGLARGAGRADARARKSMGCLGGERPRVISRLNCEPNSLRGTESAGAWATLACARWSSSDGAVKVDATVKEGNTQNMLLSSSSQFPA